VQSSSTQIRLTTNIFLKTPTYLLLEAGCLSAFCLMDKLEMRLIFSADIRRSDEKMKLLSKIMIVGVYWRLSPAQAAGLTRTE